MKRIIPALLFSISTLAFAETENTVPEKYQLEDIPEQVLSSCYEEAALYYSDEEKIKKYIKMCAEELME